MRTASTSSRVSLRRTLLLTAVVAVSVFSATAAAQGDNQPSPSTNNPPATNTPAPAPSNTNTNTNANTNTNTPNPQPSQTSQTSPRTGVITGGQSATNSGPLPTITGGDGGNGGPTGRLPTLTQERPNTEVPAYPAPSVPPTEGAPFMQHSTAPEGTVFIAVGAILGFFGLTLLAWRGFVTWALHRSVERAAMQQHQANDKAASFPAPPAPFYKSTFERDSSPNLLGAAAAGGAASSASLGRGVRRTHRGPTPSATPSQSNLFFSPTAGGGGGGAGTGSNRDSRFLPSGFYAAGSASPNNGRHEHSISLSNLRPDSRGHARAVSPPDSPSLGPSRGTPVPMQRNVSTSTLNLNRPPSGRAPSAFLDDMLDDPNAHTHMMPGGGVRPASQFSASPSPHPHNPYSPTSPTPRDPLTGSPNGGRF